MNVLPRDKQTEAVAALTEGCSIRAIERLTGVYRYTIMRLGVRVGNGCYVLHDAMMRGLHVSQLGVTDHIWTTGELVDAVFDGVVPAPGGRRYGRFTVIDRDQE
jgi:hypothetical protein